MDFLNIGEAIRVKRVASGLTGQELANRTGLQRNNLYVIERHKISINLMTLKIIADGLNVKVSQLVLLAEQLEEQKQNEH